MSTSERLLVSKQLDAGYSNLKANDKKMIQLFRLLKKSQQLKYEQLKAKVSPDSNPASFNRLLRRLTYRLEESLILEQNINRKNAYSELFRIRYKVEKKLIQAQILAGRGQIVKAISILKKVRREATTYELFDEFNKATIIYLKISISRFNTKTLNELIEELSICNKKRDSLQQIELLVSHIEILINKSITKKKHMSYLNDVIKKIKSIQFQNPTINGETYLYLLRLEKSDLTSNFRSYINDGEVLMNILKNEKAVYSKNRIIYLTNKIARYHIYLFNFSAAKSQSKQAIGLFENIYNFNYLVSIENLFLSTFYQMDYEDSLKIISKAIDERVTKKYANKLSQFYYMQSIVLLLLKQYKNVSLSLNQTSEIEKDKEGWNVWVRLLRLMIMLDQKKYDLVEYEVENFRKFVQRSEVSKNERITLIMNLLIELVRREFDYKMTSETKANELNRLENDPTVQWNINSPELIQFHNWFKAKRDQIKYQPIFNQTNYNENQNLQ